MAQGKKTYYGKGDVPRIPAHSVSNTQRSWTTGNKTLVASSSTYSVELYESGDILATFSSRRAYSLGRDLYKSQEDKDSLEAQWGQMLCSAAEYAAS